MNYFFCIRFAVIVVPNYADPADALTCPFKSSNNLDLLAEGENKSSWRWFNTVNRVCSGVKKVRFYFSRFFFVEHETDFFYFAFRFSLDTCSITSINSSYVIYA